MHRDLDMGQFGNPRDQAKEESELISRRPVGSLRKSAKAHALRLLLLATLPAMTAAACEPVEDFFSLPRLGCAGDPSVNSFGADAYHASH